MLRLMAVALFLATTTTTKANAIPIDEAEIDATFPHDETVEARLTDEGLIEIEDMLLTSEQFYELYEPVSSQVFRRVAVTGHRWPNGVVPFRFAADLVVNQTNVLKAMAEWETNTCVKFVAKQASDTAYVVIRDGQGCSSAVGRAGGVQYMSLGKNCGSRATLLHELGHTLGLLHEHSHPDRNDYIKIMWNNIPTDKHANFVLKPEGSVITFGIPYDATSIMHYTATAFANCDGCNSIEPHDPSLLKVMGKSKQLSKLSDIPIVNRMYCN